MLDSLRSVVQFRRFEFDATKRRLATAANTDDLRRIAKRRLPGGVFDYIDGGAEDERTMRANREAFSNYRFRPRVLRDVSAVDTSTSLLGKTIPLPLVLAPTGFTRIADPARRAGRRPRRPAGRPAVHAVDALDALDRGGRRGQRRRPTLVPGVRLEGQGPVPRHGRPGRCRRLRGAGDHRRHGQPRSSRARRPARVRAAAEARAGHDRRRCRAPVVDLAVRPRRADPLRQHRLLVGGRPTNRRARRRSTSPRRSPRSSTPGCRGTTSIGSGRSGTARS